MKSNRKVWYLFDENGNLIIKGKKSEVMKIASGRYVYEYIFTDKLFSEVVK